MGDGSGKAWMPRRPLYSVLDKHSSWEALAFTPPHWRDGVLQTVAEVLDA
jgi:dTDP-4-dehydrorhamnose reductase